MLLRRTARRCEEPAVGGRAGGDYDYDGDVDYLDYAALKRNYGRQIPAPGIGQPVPEPASFLLLAAGALAVVSRRRRA